ncbi:GNAT family N-acetyltransferase [Paenibacillus dokdonensis]|uniref:GNAT family N-acetyltransferase n=1 Tax=Paenibacillus dokdonensis TaxID=2567944 RepID=UPI0010A8EDCC|nr:GNAT family N-acetyltransferase [Paenibacillus dokdonensis]
MDQLEFIKFGSNDFDDYFRLVSNEKVMAMITERAIPLHEARENFEKILRRNEKFEDFGTFKVLVQSTGEFIGLGSLTRNEDQNDEAEIGYMLLPEQWGKGYGKIIAGRLLHRAEQSDVTRLTAIIDPANIPSRSILISQGFISEKVCEIGGLPGEILCKTL